MTKKKVQKPEFDVRTLKSINLEMDLAEPARLLGYVPTRKAVSLTSEVLSGLLGETSDRAFAISAPYGSGKSSAALFWCQLLEIGKSRAEIRNLVDEMRKKDRQASSADSIFGKWERRKPLGLSVPIVGFEGGSIAAAVLSSICNSLDRNKQGALGSKVKKFPKTMDGVRQAVSSLIGDSGKYDSILIVWDEFGKVLEQAALQGDGKALLEIQTLAEFASRSSSAAPVIFCILMHQTFARYSASLPGYVRNEWAKIEGRFKQVNYIEDSKEVYELISQVISRKYGKPEEKRSVYKTLADKCHQAGIFQEFDTESLTELLWSSAPLSPVSLYLLPRVSARVAQNERTMFSFLWSEEPNALPALNKMWVSPADIFDFFSDLMRLDTSVGGAHRLWVEANSALKKAENEIEEEIVKALASIKVGSSSGSLPGTLKVLELAFGKLDSGSKVKENVAELEKRKAIYLKKLTGEYSVWQGSDVDIRTAVEDQKSKLIESLHIPEVLTKEFSAPFRFPQRHNDVRCMRRYFDGRYISSNQIPLAMSGSLSGEDSFMDGRIYYVIAETTDELKTAIEAASEIEDERVLFAIPRSPLHIRDGLAEMEAYTHLLADPDFRNQDPIIEQELKQLADDSEQHLRTLVAKINQPSADGPRFFWKGQVEDVNSTGALKRLLSKVCDEVYPDTPVINNEMINKREPSPQIINARKSILRGLIERYGQEQLGITGYGPDVSIFRAVFLSTGIYKQSGKEWVFTNKATDVRDEGLSQIWKFAVDFWSKPDANAKDLKALMYKWQSAPFGMRKGVIPLLLASSFRCAGARAQIFEDGIFLSDFKPETFEKMLRAPHQFKIVVPELKKDFSAFLDQVTDVFGDDRVTLTTGDKVKNAALALMVWLKGLPQIARERGMVSAEIDDLVLTMVGARDPNVLLSESLKAVWKHETYPDTFEALKKAKRTLEEIEGVYLQKCKESLTRAVQADGKKRLNDVYIQWIHHLPGMQKSGVRERYLTHKKAAGLVSRVEQGYANEHLFVMSLAELFTEKPLKFWNSNSMSLFEVTLHQTIRWLEDQADDIDLEAWHTQGKKTDDNDLAGAWIERRVRQQFERVIQRLGKSEGKAFVERVIASLEDGV